MLSGSNARWLHNLCNHVSLKFMNKVEELFSFHKDVSLGQQLNTCPSKMHGIALCQ